MIEHHYYKFLLRIDGRPLEKFNIFNGYGRNGKGFIDDLALATVGHYGMIGNNNMLFDENNNNNNGYSANNEKNAFGEPLRSIGVPRIPSKLLEQAEREYRRRWKLGGTRKRKVSRRRTLKKHGK